MEQNESDFQNPDAPVSSNTVDVFEYENDDVSVTMTETATTETTKEAGMPQLNVDTFASQIFWLVVTFAFLYLLLGRSILPRIHTVMESRQNKITHDIDRAEQLRNEAEEARETYERALKESRSKAQALISESAALMDKSSAARHAELDKKLEKQLADAESGIASAKTDALAKLAPVSKELTQQIVEKLTGQKLQAAEVGAVVDSLIKEKGHA
jgi:F-type H+-transporting ATPase subunit b